MGKIDGNLWLIGLIPVGLVYLLLGILVIASFGGIGFVFLLVLGGVPYNCNMAVEQCGFSGVVGDGVCCSIMVEPVISVGVGALVTCLLYLLFTNLKKDS